MIRAFYLEMGWMSEWRYLVPISSLVIILNLIAVIITLKSRKERRKSTTALMVSLQASDATFGAIILPVRMIEIWLAYSEVFPYVYAYLVLVSALNSFSLSLDRYASVVKPLWRRLISNGTIMKGLLVIWICPLLVSLIPLTWTHVTGYNSLATFIYSYCLVGILIFIMLFIILFQALVMRGLFQYWSKLKKDASMRQSLRGRNSSEFKQKLNSTMLCSCLIITTVLTWLPTIIYNFIDEASLSKFSLFALMVNSMFDPFLVILFNSKGMCVGCCKRIRLSLFTPNANSVESINVLSVKLNQPPSVDGKSPSTGEN